mmetsp:Transcript_28771/g.45127  ORF Transcript_28771/g.45127 Transcript_28771/m.45127 type:complete len:82 (-) Transcript_28771:170-415(-)
MDPIRQEASPISSGHRPRQSSKRRPRLPGVGSTCEGRLALFWELFRILQFVQDLLLLLALSLYVLVMQMWSDFTDEAVRGL